MIRAGKTPANRMIRRISMHRVNQRRKEIKIFMAFAKLFVALALLGTGACATPENGSGPASDPRPAADGQSTAPQSSGTAENKPGMICRREHQTGSNRPRRVCYPLPDSTAADAVP
jgi:hypothetical protein